ncbi:hypothetical protein L7F22_053766 [Adiantum nelumboides]|nr:hypothetical protein [Adiantum nelumboides]
MTEQTMHRLGLKVNAPAPCKAKMANNSKVKCLGVINALKIKVCEIEVEVDVYVMPTKGEGYPIILGRPWLMAMHARQDWGTVMLELQPHKGAKKGKAIHIDLRGGKHESLDLETSVDEFSSFDYSTSEEESTITDESDSSQAEIMGVVLTNPTMVSSINVSPVEEGKIAKMLSKNLTQEERQAYLAMLEGYPRLFIDGYDQITGVFVVQHHINLKDGAKPVVQRLRRLGVIQQDALLSEVRKLLNAGFIYPVEDSEWVSPVVVTPKKNGKWRVCVDYKPLNAATKRDHFPLPFQDEILNEVAGYERYTVCDGYSGYFQIRIAEEDQKKTTFVTPWGCFAYRVMPFGLTNAPATFQRFVTHVFQPFFGKSIRVFIDDFCIYSSRVLHLEKVNEGLARLQSLGGQLNVDKCHIAESQVTLLGHVVSSRGIEADPGKVQALVSLPSPKSAKELVSFIQKHMDVSACISKWLVRLQEFEYTVQVKSSTRASLAGMLTHRCYERKVKVKAPGPEPVEVQAKLSGAHSLYFDGAYKRKVDKASVGISIQDENGQKVFGKGLLVENTHSNNEAKYAALALGLEWCVSMGIKRLNVFGDALLLIKQVHGTWACRNQSLVPRLRRVKELMKRFEAIQLYHVPKKGNQEADALASEQLQEVIVGAIKLQNPLFQGSDCMHDIVNFLEIGECPQDMSKGQRQWLVHKATKYRLINEHLYCKGKDLVMRRVPHSKDIKQANSITTSLKSKPMQSGILEPNHLKRELFYKAYSPCNLSQEPTPSTEKQQDAIVPKLHWGCPALTRCQELCHDL